MTPLELEALVSGERLYVVDKKQLSLLPRGRMLLFTGYARRNSRDCFSNEAPYQESLVLIKVSSPESLFFLRNFDQIQTGPRLDVLARKKGCSCAEALPRGSVVQKQADSP